MQTNYISLDSILYLLSTLVPEEDWSERDFRTWATEGAMKIMPEALLVDYVKLSNIDSHRSIIPQEVKYLNTIWAYKTEEEIDLGEVTSLLNLDNETDNPALPYMDNSELLPTRVLSLLNQRQGWFPLMPTSSPLMNAILCTDDLYLCPDCRYEYSVDGKRNLTSTLKNGLLLISYKSFPVEENGTLLIPDEANFKDAIRHFALHMMYMKKVIYGEKELKTERDYHLRRFEILGMKSKSMDLPGLELLEKMKNESNRLVQRTNRFDNGFTNLGLKPKTSY